MSWMNCRFPQPDASCRLFCFPWAGGGSTFYAAWGKLMTDNLEVVGITLPGRESRFKDSVDYTVAGLVDAISSEIHNNYADKPFAFWGHSMGGLLAFSTACLLKSKYHKEPVHMYVSGISAPHSSGWKNRNTNFGEMTNDEFILYLKNLGGTPIEILDNQEMMDLFLPALRADYNLLDQFKMEAADKWHIFCDYVTRWTFLPEGFIERRPVTGAHQS